jgi:glycosyltransferase involved in cell wall biosynthesis
VLLQTLDRVRAHTRTPYDLVVADDGSEDGTAAAMRALGVRLVTGRNMGIAWNKNRALFLLAHIRRCNVVILLEDDSSPTHTGWEVDWIAASLAWGHANLAGGWLRQSFLSGTGTVADPILSLDVTAQCSSFWCEALAWGGYFDTRFRGYGQEHVEHTRRLIKAGYGGTFEDIEGEVRPIYKLLSSAIDVRAGPSFSDDAERDRNLLMCQQLLFDESYRMPWREDAEMVQFRGEMQAATGTFAMTA